MKSFRNCAGKHVWDWRGLAAAFSLLLLVIPDASGQTNPPGSFSFCVTVWDKVHSTGTVRLRVIGS